MTREEAIAELSVLHERLSNPKDYEDGCYSWKDGRYVEALDMAIEALQDDWIPVNERLPMVGEDVLFCDNRWVEEGCLRMDGDWWMFRWSAVQPKEKIIAWKPLPEPYKESDNE